MTYLEKEPDNKHLQRPHADNQTNLDDAEIDDSLFRAVDSAEVSVLACAEVFLVSGDGRQLAGDLVEGLLEHGGLFGGSALLRWQLSGARLVLNL